MSNVEDCKKKYDNFATFESAFERIEKILEMLNAKSVSLDDSIKLYEEAHKLIKFCDSKLSNAEKRIEILTKDREGNLVFNDRNDDENSKNNIPAKENFDPLDN